MTMQDSLAQCEWVTLSRAIHELVAVGVLPPFEQDPVDDCYYMAPGAEEQLTTYLCPLAFAGRVHLQGYPTDHGEELPNGPLQAIPATYFHRQRLFFGFNGISRMPCDPTFVDWERDRRLTQSGHPEPDWTDVLVSGPDLSNLLGATTSHPAQRSAKKPKASGPGLDRVIDTMRVARVWKAEREAAGTLPATPRGRALACIEDRRKDLKLGFEALRKIFEGNYVAARRAVEEGLAVAVWDT